MVNKFWSKKNLASKEGIALSFIDNDISYKDLDKLVTNFSATLKLLDIQNKLAYLPMSHDLESIVRYLSCLREKFIPILLPPNLDEGLKLSLQKLYKPGVIFDEGDVDNFKILNQSEIFKINSKTAILLSTSGSTGSPKLVRLSYKNISSNASSIMQYLNISTSDKALCTLPLSYSYGLSVLNSHLSAGGCIFLIDSSPFDKNFYEIIRQKDISSICGVPFFYQMLFRTGFLKEKFSSLKILTQAGGRMPEKLAIKFNEYSLTHNLNFFIMYGQTEASARISYVPPESLSFKYNSIGIPIPGGKLSLAEDNELIFNGPNVMLGYAENIFDLSLDDLNDGILHTGDIAKVDSEGFYYIIGRKKRFIKIAGSRFSLDEIENALEYEFNIPFIAIGDDDKLSLKFESQKIQSEQIYNYLTSKFLMNRTFIRLEKIKEIPYTSNGKKNYLPFQKS
ncbi:AMP-binding protein [Gammaproteobacteria bacterium]|nr:AMP-binding protein [Gammaproteobacteria bacterium]